MNQPIAGGSLFAVKRGTGEVTVSAFSGTTNLSFNPANGGLFFVPNVAQAILNGNYVLPLPKGLYNVGVEAVDGLPVPAANISFTTQIGNFFGQQNFTEEFFDKTEAALERLPGDNRHGGEESMKRTPTGLSCNPRLRGRLIIFFLLA